MIDAETTREWIERRRQRRIRSRFLSFATIMLIFGILYLDIQRGGEQVFESDDVAFGAQQTYRTTFDVQPEHIGDTHDLHITTSGSSVVLETRITNELDEIVLHQQDESATPDNRVLEFEPRLAGEHEIVIEWLEGTSGKSEPPDMGMVYIIADDRRILAPLVADWFKGQVEQ